MWTKEQMLDLIKNNNQAVLRAIIVLYDRQTPEEKAKGEAIEDNFIGFSGYDSKYLGDLAKQLLKEKRIKRDDFWRARYRLRKYAGQLAEIANEKEVENECMVKNI